MSSSITERRIYVACLASYNSGSLNGVWIDTEGKDVEDIQDEVNAMLRASPYPNVEVDCPDCGTAPDSECKTCNGTGNVPSAEEPAIHNHEGFGALLGEYDSFERVAALDHALEEHGDAMLAYLSAFGSDVDIEKFEEVYYGLAASERQFAKDFAFESGLVSDDSPLLGYIDWQAYWDGELRHSFMYEDGYVFNSNW